MAKCLTWLDSSKFILPSKDSRAFSQSVVSISFRHWQLSFFVIRLSVSSGSRFKVSNFMTWVFDLKFGHLNELPRNTEIPQMLCKNSMFSEANIAIGADETAGIIGYRRRSSYQNRLRRGHWINCHCDSVVQLQSRFNDFSKIS